MEGLPSIYKGVRANAHRAGAHSALTPFPFGVTLKGLGVNPRVRPSGPL